MNQININSFRSSYYNRTAYNFEQRSKENLNQSNWSQEAATFERSSATIENDQTRDVRETVELSRGAQDVLKKLQEKYVNMNFIVGNFSTEEEAQSMLSRHMDKEYSVLIDPECLEKMAASQDSFDKYEGILKDAVGQLDSIKEQLGSDADKVKFLGISVDREGKVSFFAEMEKANVKQRELLDAKRAARREEAKQNEDKEMLEKRERSEKLRADSAQDLLNLIRNYRFDRPEGEGAHLDFIV